jgi:hypothetical protein
MLLIKGGFEKSEVENVKEQMSYLSISWPFSKVKRDLNLAI